MRVSSVHRKLGKTGVEKTGGSGNGSTVIEASSTIHVRVLCTSQPVNFHETQRIQGFIWRCTRMRQSTKANMHMYGVQPIAGMPDATQ